MTLLPAGTPPEVIRLLGTAERLIKKWGQLGDLERPTTTGPAHNPQPGPPDKTKALFVVTEFQDRQIDGQRILETDKQVYLSVQRDVDGVMTPLGFAPAPDCQLIEADGGILNIVRVNAIKPGAHVLLYLIQCRR